MPTALVVRPSCRRNGGQLFTASSVKPPQLYPKVFAVCPPSLPQDAEQALAGDSAFRVVHRSCYVTVKWLDVCVRVSAQRHMFCVLQVLIET
jgi:hypothetical protein